MIEYHMMGYPPTFTKAFGVLWPMVPSRRPLPPHSIIATFDKPFLFHEN